MISAEDWPLVIIESPYAPNEILKDQKMTELVSAVEDVSERARQLREWMKIEVERNLEYAHHCCANALSRKEVPYASHMFFTQFLDDRVPAEREIGMTAGYAMWRGAARIAFYLDKGWSPGMLRAKARADRLKIPIDCRTLQESTNG